MKGERGWRARRQLGVPVDAPHSDPSSICGWSRDRSTQRSRRRTSWNGSLAAAFSEGEKGGGLARLTAATEAEAARTWPPWIVSAPPPPLPPCRLGRSIYRAVANEEWLTVPEVAKLLRVGEATVFGAIARDELPASGWPFRVRRSHLEEYINRSRIRPGQLGRTMNQYAGRPEEGVAEWYQSQRRQRAE